MLPLNGQSGESASNAIPDNLNNVFQTSCMPCHGEKGGRLPGSKLNFSRWKGYGPAKEADKAFQICSALQKESMPPKTFRKKHPELVPTPEQIKLICKWAESINPGKAKK